MRFADILQRGYGKTDPSWWNALQAAGLALEQLIGGSNSGAIAETGFAFANNQGSFTNVTGLLLDSTKVKSAYCWISSRRTTGSNTVRAEIELWLNYSDTTVSWQIVDLVEHALAGAASGLTFQVTAGGQVQYKSTNIAGSGYADTSKFKTFAMGT